MTHAPRPYEIAPDASWFDAEPANLTAPPARRPWWIPDFATAFLIVAAAFVFALLAVIAANRFVF